MASNKRIKTKKLPQKKTINVAVIGQNKINIFIALPAMLLIIFVAGLFSKVAVVDRYLAMQRTLAEESSIQKQVDDMYEKLRSYEEVAVGYNHYTYSGMTTEELTRSDRMGVVELLNERVFPYVTSNAWSLQDNVLYIPMKADTLEEINKIVASLEQDDRVSFCTVNTAVTEEKKIESVTKKTIKDKDGNERETEETNYIIVTKVKGNITCYLNKKTSFYDELKAETAMEGEDSNENTQP